MQEKLFTVFKSSAGSGKTYTLAKSYLILALQFPEKYRRILAVTFTNKATQEMKDRIIETLAHFSEGKNSDMGKDIIDVLSISERELTLRSKDLLARILHNYSRFSIQTIDTFFQSVMKSFSRELGLHGDGELLLDTSEAREQVIDLLLEDLNNNQHLRDWLLEFSTEKLENAKSWDVRKDILEFSKQLANEDFLAIENELLGSIKESKNIVAYKSRLFKLTSSFESEMNNFGLQALKLVEQHGLSISDFSYGKSGAVNYFNNIIDGKYEPGKRVYEALDTNGEKLAAKSSKKRDQIAALSEAGLIKLFQQATTLFEKDYTKYATAKAILSNIYSLGILWLYQKRLVDYKKEEGILFINDATLFLNRIIADEETPFVYEKMGAFYDHFLIDEFQDTSAFQWNNFKPLINNSLDQGNPNLVVGDVKQSIYRWRGGDWRLLLNGIKNDVRGHAYQEQNLDRNFRSKPEVIDFNNDLFTKLPALLEQHITTEIAHDDLTEHLEDNLYSFSQAYNEVYQKKKDTYAAQGYINIKFFDKEVEELGWKEQALDKLINDLQLLQDKNVKLSDIAILVRKAAHGKEINDFLLQYQQHDSSKYKYDVISNESLYLSASLLVTFILNCFRYLYSPNNRVALAQVVYYYQRIVVGNQVEEHDLLHACNERNDLSHIQELLPQSFLENREDLLNINLLDLSERLIQYFELGKQSDEIPYLQAFQDVLLEFGNKGDIQDFLEWWENNQTKYSVKIPESTEAIRLLTVHKSKGLQFKVVLIPFLDWPLNHGSKGPILWLPSAVEELPKDIPYMPIKHSGSALKQSYFAKDFWKEEIKSYLDNLNLLYVAFTRAEDALLVTGQKKAGNKQIAGVVEQVLSESDLWDEEHSKYEKGRLEFAKAEEAGNNVKPEPVYLKDYPSINWSHKLEVRKGKALKLSEEKLESKRKINLGLLVHDAFSRMKYLADKDRVLQELLTENALTQEQLDQVNELVLGNLDKNQAFKKWFNTDWEVRTEVPIVNPKGKDIRIDRVHLKGVEAEIIDFKTGVKKSVDIKQVKTYQSILKTMGYQKVDGFLAYLDPFEIVEVK